MEKRTKWLLFAACVILFAGYGHLTGRRSDAGKADTTAQEASGSSFASWNEGKVDREIGERLCAIYDDVFGWYTKAEGDTDMPDDMPDFDALYMSSGYKELLSKVKAKDEEVEAEGMIGFFDYDHWVCGQDFSGLKMSVTGGEMVDGNTCNAEVEILNCGEVQQIGITLVRENGEWLIDDFITVFGNERISEKERMRLYVAQ